MFFKTLSTSKKIIYSIMSILTIIVLLLHISYANDPDFGTAGAIAGFFMMIGVIYGLYFFLKLIYCIIKRKKKLKTFLAFISFIVIAFYSTAIMLNYISPEKMKAKADKAAAGNIQTETLKK